MHSDLWEIVSTASNVTVSICWRFKWHYHLVQPSNSWCMMFSLLIKCAVCHQTVINTMNQQYLDWMALQWQYAPHANWWPPTAQLLDICMICTKDLYQNEQVMGCQPLRSTWTKANCLIEVANKCTSGWKRTDGETSIRAISNRVINTRKWEDHWCVRCFVMWPL